MSGAIETMIAVREKTRKGWPWWMEMAMVDFRNLLWPWLIYAGAVFAVLIVEVPTGSSNIWISGLALVSMSAFITQCFSSDYSHKTIETLLVFPRDRVTLWLVRTIFCAVLIVIPIVAYKLEILRLNLVYGLNYAGRPLLEGVVVYGYGFFVFGNLFAILLKRPLVTWTAVLISPLLIFVVWALLAQVFNFETTTTRSFPYMPAIAFWLHFLLGILALVIAWRRWLRLEVRS